MYDKKKDYVEVVYNQEDRPLTDYPMKLSSYLFNRYKLNQDKKLLDLGCGRGEFLKGFINCGLEGYGVDQSDSAKEFCPEAKLKRAALDREPIPFEDNYFDVVFSKSVIEHFHNPEILVEEIYRVLKPGGVVITMCPDWEVNYKMYFEDYTHKTPFTLISLRDIFLIHGFSAVSVEKFRQLPILWKFKFLIIFTEITRKISPNFLKPYSKWVRFSKEVMLLSYCEKPKS